MNKLQREWVYWCPSLTGLSPRDLKLIERIVARGKLVHRTNPQAIGFQMALNLTPTVGDTIDSLQDEVTFLKSLIFDNKYPALSPYLQQLIAVYATMQLEIVTHQRKTDDAHD